MKKNMAIVLAISVAGVALHTQAATVSNTNITFNTSQTMPESGGDEYWFNGGLTSTWMVNDYARVIMQGGGANNRFFVGVNGSGTMNLSTAAGKPGLFSAMGNTYAAYRIGTQTHSGALNVNSGVQVDVGEIWGDGSGSKVLNINQGRMNMLDASHRGQDLATHVGQQGRLFTIGTVSSVADYQTTHAAGSTLTADAGRKIRFITAGVEHSPFHTASSAAGVDGTLITTIPDTYKEINLSNQSFGNGFTDWTVVEVGGDRIYEDENVPGLQGNRVALLKARGDINYLQQVLSSSEEGAMDAGTFTNFEIQFDLGYRREAATSGDGEFEVSLWNITDGVELDSLDITLTDPGTESGNNFMTAMLVNFSYDTTGLSGKDLALRFTNTKDLGTSDWRSTLTLDNVSVSAIPEPATIGLILGMGGAMLFVRRKWMK